MTLQKHNEIEFIEYLIYTGKAYTIHLDNSETYVIAVGKHYPNKKCRIEHEDICSLKRHNDDFVIWYPDNKQGLNSPWGIGYASANLYVRCVY